MLDLLTYAGTLMLVIGVAAARVIFDARHPAWPALVPAPVPAPAPTPAPAPVAVAATTAVVVTTANTALRIVRNMSSHRWVSASASPGLGRSAAPTGWG